MTTREEQIDLVKRLIATGISDEAREVLEKQFPELKESEDERIRKHLVAIVEMYWGKTNDPDKAKDLAYLEKQKEQKPAEWSEEDEKHSAFIVAALDAYYRLRKESNNYAGQEDLDKAVDWLHRKFKSLHPQPHWKPSEEQMNVLNCAIKVYLKQTPIGEIHLKTLYEQFKKL